MGIFNRKLTPEAVAEYLKGLTDEEKETLDALLDAGEEKAAEEKAEEKADKEEEKAEKIEDKAEAEAKAEEKAEDAKEDAGEFAELKAQIAEIAKTMQALEARVDAIKPAEEPEKKPFGASMAGAEDKNADAYSGSVEEIRKKYFGF